MPALLSCARPGVYSSDGRHSPRHAIQAPTAMKPLGVRWAGPELCMGWVGELKKDPAIQDSSAWLASKKTAIEPGKKGLFLPP